MAAHPFHGTEMAATCPDTFANSHMHSLSESAGVAPLLLQNRTKEQICFLVLTSLQLPLKCLKGARSGSGIVPVRLEPRSKSILRRCVSLAIQRGNNFIQATYLHFIELEQAQINLVTGCCCLACIKI